MLPEERQPPQPKQHMQRWLPLLLPHTFSFLTCVPVKAAGFSALANNGFSLVKTPKKATIRGAAAAAAAAIAADLLKDLRPVTASSRAVPLIIVGASRTTKAAKSGAARAVASASYVGGLKTAADAPNVCIVTTGAAETAPSSGAAASPATLSVFSKAPQLYKGISSSVAFTLGVTHFVSAAFFNKVACILARSSCFSTHTWRSSHNNNPIKKNTCSRHVHATAKCPINSSTGLKDSYEKSSAAKKNSRSFSSTTFDDSSTPFNKRTTRNIASSAYSTAAEIAGATNAATTTADSPVEIVETLSGERHITSIALCRHLVRCVGFHYLLSLLQRSDLHHQQQQPKLTESEVFDALWNLVLHSNGEDAAISTNSRQSHTNNSSSSIERDTEVEFYEKPKKGDVRLAVTNKTGDGAPEGGRRQRLSDSGNKSNRSEASSRVSTAVVNRHVHMTTAIASASATSGEATGAWAVTVDHFCIFLRGCMHAGLRELELLDALCEVLEVLVAAPRTPKIATIIDLADACTALALWRPPLFIKLAEVLLSSLKNAPSGAVLNCAAAPPNTNAGVSCESGTGTGNSAEALKPYEAVILLEAFSHQRVRNEELLLQLTSHCLSPIGELSPRLCCRLLHALALLRRLPAADAAGALFQRIEVAATAANTAEASRLAAAFQKSAASAAKLEDASAAPETHAAVKGAVTMSQQYAPLRLVDLTKAVHALFLLELELEQKDLLLKLLCAMVPLMFEQPDEYWSSSTPAANLHKQLLLVHSALRFIHRAHLYDQLPAVARNAFRRLQRIEILRKPRPPTNFVVRMSELLTKLRIAHFCYATRGPLVFDVLERDRRLVWQCNTVDRFYARTAEKTAATSLQERIANGMGLRVANCEFWQWMKMKRKRTRLEYLRMQRYYALKDRRQFDEDFEGWTLPLVHRMHRRSKLHYEHYFPNYVPLSRVEY